MLRTKKQTLLNLFPCIIYLSFVWFGLLWHYYLTCFSFSFCIVKIRLVLKLDWFLLKPHNFWSFKIDWTQKKSHTQKPKSKIIFDRFQNFSLSLFLFFAVYFQLKKTLFKFIVLEHTTFYTDTLNYRQTIYKMKHKTKTNTYKST